MNRIIILLGLHFAGVVLFFYLATRGNDGMAIQAGGKSQPKILRLAIDSEPKSLDPITITDTISDGVARKVHNTLVRFEKDKSGALIVGPDLAERFEVSSDGLHYTFWLRKGVKFHNGREMKAADFVYSLSRLLTSPSKRPDWLSPMVAGSEEFYKSGRDKIKFDEHPPGIRAKDEYTLEIELTKPFAPFIQHLCTVNCAVVPFEEVEKWGDAFARHPMGVGAFILSDWRNNEKLIFKRNDDYFRGRPKLDAITFSIIKEPAIRMEQYFAGTLDAASDLPSGRVKEAVARAGEANVLVTSTMRTNYLGIGQANGKYEGKESLQTFGKNKKLRQAINYAIDREYLCKDVLEGRGIPATGILPPGMPGYKKRAGWPRDLEKAKALLVEAGYPGGKGLEKITLWHRNDENTKKSVQTVQADLKQIGIEVDLVPREWKTFLDLVDKEPQPMFWLGWVADYPDPDNFLYVLFHTSQWGPPGNATFYSNKKVDELLEKARFIPNIADRIPLYEQVEDMILEDAPWICTYNVVNLVLLNKKVKGIRENATPLDTGSEFPQVDFAFVDIEE